MTGASTAKRGWTMPNFENISFVLVFLGLPLAIFTIFYYDLRVRKEAFDLELIAQQLAAP